MDEPSRQKKSRHLELIATAIIAILIISSVSYRLYLGIPATPQLNDPENDVFLNVGTQYPRMIDLVSAVLEANVTTLQVSINVKDSIPDLSDGEYVQWNVTVILENETGVLKAYEMWVEMNSTELGGSIVEVEGQIVQRCQVDYYRNSLTVRAIIDELKSAKTVEWFLLTTYEKFLGDELIISASDIAPDEGLQKTVLET